MGLIGMTLQKADNGTVAAEGSNPSRSTKPAWRNWQPRELTVYCVTATIVS